MFWPINYQQQRLALGQYFLLRSRTARLIVGEIQTQKTRDFNKIPSKYIQWYYNRSSEGSVEENHTYNVGI